MTLPEHYATNQQPSKIVLRFNEYVQVKDAAKNVVMSPPSLQRPEVRIRGKGVQVVFNDSLKTNTTYVIDFGAAISGLNEDNPFPPCRYVFCTGATIDSMMLTGKVLDAYTKEPLPAAMVALYEDHSDTAIYKTLPVAMARADEWGYFILQNIKPKSYNMVAFVDKNSNLKYDSGSEMLAFLDSTVFPATVISDYKTLLTPIDPKDTLHLLARPYEWELHASAEKVGKQFLKDQELTGKRQISLVFSQPHAIIDSLLIKDIAATDMVVERNRFSDTLIYWITAAVLPDTLSASITYHRTDSLDLLSPYTTPLKLQLKKEEKKDDKKKDKEEKEPKLVPDISYSAEIIMKKGVLLKFPTLLAQLNQEKIQLWKKDAKDRNVKTQEPFTLTADSVYLRQYRLQAKWQTGTDYELSLLPDAFIDIYGLANDTIVKPVNTENPDRYSSIKFVITGVEPDQQIIVQLLDEKKAKILREEIITINKAVLMDYLRAGKYTLRLIRDDNKNSIWDPAIYLEHRQPESVEFYTLSDGKEVITLSDNTDITQNVNAVAVFARNRKNEIPSIDETPLEEEKQTIKKTVKKTGALNDNKNAELKK
jgi:hypothetical protein